MRQQRFDRATILDWQDAPGGYLTVKATIARPGVFPYMRADGTIQYEAKLPDDIFSDLVIDSARAKPVTDEHPPELVTLQNHSKYARGMSHTDSRVEGGKIAVTLTVTDAALIQRVKDGSQKEISIGFETDLVAEPGEYQGAKYDQRQTNININHIAIVKRGRAGPEVAIRGDAAIEIEKEDAKMPVVKIDGKDHEVPSEVKSYVDALQAKLDAASTKAGDFDKLQGRHDALETENTNLKTQLEEAKKNSLTQDALDKAVKERVDLLDSSRLFLGDAFDFSGKSDRDVKVAVITKVKPDFKADGKTDDYLNAFYEATVGQAKQDGFRSTGPNHLFTGDGYGADSQREIEKMRSDRLNIKNKTEGGK